jgi:hypothetical protein
VKGQWKLFEDLSVEIESGNEVQGEAVSLRRESIGGESCGLMWLQQASCHFVCGKPTGLACRQRSEISVSSGRWIGKAYGTMETRGRIVW